MFLQRVEFKARQTTNNFELVSMKKILPMYNNTHFKLVFDEFIKHPQFSFL